MKIEEIDAISYKNNKAREVKENVVQDETITLTINKWFSVNIMVFILQLGMKSYVQ